jgi:hypothetical protein
LAVIVFLKMSNLPFKLEQRPNAEFMSPNGFFNKIELMNLIFKVKFHSCVFKVRWWLNFRLLLILLAKRFIILEFN